MRKVSLGRLAVQGIMRVTRYLERQGLLVLDVDDQTDVGGGAMPTGIGLNYMPKKKTNTVHDGDSRSDIKSGRSTGMKTIAVLSSFDDLQALSKEFPDAVINSVAELKTIIDC